MRIEPSQSNKAKLLKKSPLTSCFLQPGWNNSGWLADSIMIFPNRSKTDTTYENNRDNIVEQKRRHERLLLEAEKVKEDIWRLEDEESDEEMQQRIRELRGTSEQKAKPTQRLSQVNQSSYSTAET